MKSKIILVMVSMLVVLGLVAIGFGCTAPTPTPTLTPTPTSTPTLTPTPKPTVTPTPTPSPSPTQPQVIKWRGQNGYPMVPPPDMDRFLKYGKATSVTGVIAQFYVDWLEWRTGGRLKIDLAQPAAIVPVASLVEYPLSSISGRAILPIATVQTALPPTIAANPAQAIVAATASEPGTRFNHF